MKNSTIRVFNALNTVGTKWFLSSNVNRFESSPKSILPPAYRITSINDETITWVDYSPAIKKGSYADKSLQNQKNEMQKAQLISAAPEMLKALYLSIESMKMIEKYHPEAITTVDKMRMQSAQEAIDKATKEQF